MIAHIIGVAVIVLLTGLLTTFAIPVEEWRTGDQCLTPLTYTPVPTESDVPRRLWIDTDASCGYSRRTDSDDCFAIALLAYSSDFQIVGISTVFGNAPIDVVDRTTIELARRLSVEIGQTLPVHRGYPGPLAQIVSSPRPPAYEALVEALEQGPLTIVALGPLTNLAAVLSERPALRSQVVRLVSVMGRRQGHIFHPTEGANSGILFGHGPVFRDFNFVMDVRASSQIIDLNLPTTLIPYDAARGIEMTAGDLDRLTASGRAISWLAERARPWLSYWHEDIGRQGFYPFDLLAAAHVVEPNQFGCAPVRIWVGKDPMLSVPYWQSTALLVDQGIRPLEKVEAVGSALYCAKVETNIKSKLMGRLIAGAGTDLSGKLGREGDLHASDQPAPSPAQQESE